MVAIKYVYQAINAVFVLVWGFTIIEVMPLVTIANIKNLEMFNGIDNIVKTIMAVAGLVYFVYRFWEHAFVTTPHKKKMNKLEQELKTQQIEKLARENGKANTVTREDEPST